MTHILVFVKKWIKGLYGIKVSCSFNSDDFDHIFTMLAFCLKENPKNAKILKKDMSSLRPHTHVVPVL